MLTRYHICRHEAAHFIVAWITGTKPQRIAIRRKTGTVFMPDAIFLEWQIAIYTAGPIIDCQIEGGSSPETFIAEYVSFADRNGKTDYDRISLFLQEYGIPRDQWWRMIEAIVSQTAAILKENEKYLDEITDFLNRHGSCDRKTTDALFQSLPKNLPNPIPGKYPIWKTKIFIETTAKKEQFGKLGKFGKLFITRILRFFLDCVSVWRYIMFQKGRNAIKQPTGEQEK